MSKLTLLDMVQDILSDLESDEVNSVSDTTEALQVAQIIKTTYSDIVVRKYLPHLKTIFALDATNSSTPTHMKLPVNIMEMDEIYYDNRVAGATNSKFTELVYKDPSEFIVSGYGLDADLSNVDEVVDPSGITLKIKNDTKPTYWTSFDDEYVVFDSYDSSIESNMQNSKSQVMGYREPTMTIADTAVADLPSEAFPYLLSEAKKHCLAKLGQVAVSDTAYIEEVKRNKKQNTWLQRKKWRTRTQSKYPHYGRN